MIDLDRLTADQLRALFARTPDAVTRRAIQRRLQQLADQPPPTPESRKLPEMQESEFRRLFRSRLPPSTCAWSLQQITETLDRTTVEWHERKKGKK